MKRTMLIALLVITVVSLWGATTALADRQIYSYEYTMTNTTTTSWYRTPDLLKVNTGQAGINNVTVYSGDKNAAFKFRERSYSTPYTWTDATNVKFQMTGRYSYSYLSGYGYANWWYELCARRNTDDPIKSVYIEGSWSPDTTN